MIRIWCAICNREMTGPALACACPKGMGAPTPVKPKETGR